MAKNIEKIAAGSVPGESKGASYREEARSVPPGWPTSSPPFRLALCLGKAAAPVGQPMRAGCGIPRCR